ncbi:MAG TPA: hypothetical protein VF454_07680 [Gemmatimonadales bacterium]
MEGVIAVFALFGVPGIYFLGKTDIGQAIVYRLRNGDVGQDPALLAEVDELRARLSEVEERLDFAERQLVSGVPPRPLAPTPES